MRARSVSYASISSRRDACRPAGRTGVGTGIVLFLAKPATGLIRTTDIDGGLTFLDEGNLAFFVDDESCAVGNPPRFHQNAVSLGYLPFGKVAKHRKLSASLFREDFLAWGIVGADPEHLCFLFLKLR